MLFTGDVIDFPHFASRRGIIIGAVSEGHQHDRRFGCFNLFPAPYLPDDRALIMLHVCLAQSICRFGSNDWQRSWTIALCEKDSFSFLCRDAGDYPIMSIYANQRRSTYQPVGNPTTESHELDPKIQKGPVASLNSLHSLTEVSDTSHPGLIIDGSKPVKTRRPPSGYQSILRWWMPGNHIILLLDSLFRCPYRCT
jgi:hypothetical protein